MRLYLACVLALFFLPSVWAAKELQIFFIDVEGGQATLIATPGGDSLLIDTGHAGFSGRDPDRIMAAAKAAKLKRIDYVLITSYDQDHFGGLSGLSDRIAIGTVLDRGPMAEMDKRTKVVGEAYQRTLEKVQHQVLKPGDTIPVKNLDVRIVAAGGKHIDQPLDGAGQPNAACTGFGTQPRAEGEGSRAVGAVITYGDFRLVDLGALTEDQELGLVCPNNLLGRATVYVTGGTDAANPPALIDALHPRLVIMNNAARKGAEPGAWKTIRNSPGLEDIWQLHFAINNGSEENPPDTLIANLDEACEGKTLHMLVQPDGAFTITNTRNKFARSYPAR